MKSPHCYNKSHATWHPAAATFPSLPQPKLVLDLETLERCKAELTWWWLYPKMVYPPKTVTFLGNNPSVSWLKTEPSKVASPMS